MSAKTVGKDSGYKSGGLDCVYGQKDNRIWTGSAFFKKRVQVAEPGFFLIQYDTVQAPCDTLV